MTTLRSRVVQMLTLQGGWVQRDALDALTTSRVALDDVLADLVTEGEAEFRRHIGYRLTGSLLVRRACQRLEQAPELQRVVLGYERQTDAGVQTVLGVAQRHPSLPGRLVGFEVELPLVGSQSEGLRQAVGVLHAFNEGAPHG